MASGTSGAMSTSNQYIKYTISIVENSTSIVNNTSNVTVSVRFYRTNSGYTTYGTGTVYCAINGTTYSASVTPSQKITNSGIVLFSKTLDIAHNSDGTKTLATSASISHNAPLSSNGQGYSLTLSTIPRASGLTVGDGTLGTAQTITADRKASSFTHTLTWQSGSYSGTICTKSSATSWSFTPKMELANGAPNGTRVYCSFTLTTYNGSIAVGSTSKAVWFTIPDSVKPTCSLTVTDITDYPVGGDYDIALYPGAFLQNISLGKASITANGSYGSTIVAYMTTINTNIYTGSTFNFVPSDSGTVTIKTIVADSRGRKAETSTTINVIAYSPVNIVSLSAYRCDATGIKKDRGEYVVLEGSINYAYGIQIDQTFSDKNTLSINNAYIKKSTDTKYEQELSFTKTSTEQIPFFNFASDTYGPIDPDSSYDIKFTASDYWSTETKTFRLPEGFCIYHVPASGHGITFGGTAEKDGFNVKMDAHFTKKLTYDIPADSYNANEVIVSGKYYMGNESTNRPIAKNGWLEVQSYDDGNYCYQKFIVYTGEIYERWKNNGTWGSWIQTNKGQNVLWHGVSHLNGSQNAYLSQPISSQANGIYLMFSRYDNSTNKVIGNNFVTSTIYKKVLDLDLTQHNSSNDALTFTVPLFDAAFWMVGGKELFIHDTYIGGSSTNTTSGTSGTSNIKYNNIEWVLRYVIGF